MAGHNEDGNRETENTNDAIQALVDFYNDQAQVNSFEDFLSEMTEISENLENDLRVWWGNEDNKVIDAHEAEMLRIAQEIEAERLRVIAENERIAAEAAEVERLRLEEEERLRHEAEMERIRLEQEAEEERMRLEAEALAAAEAEAERVRLE